MAKGQRGGVRPGAGRPKGTKNQFTQKLIVTALRELYADTDENGNIVKRVTPKEAKVKFLQDLSESSAGKIFLAEHLFGKPVQEVEQTIHDNTEKKPREFILKNADIEDVKIIKEEK